MSSADLSGLMPPVSWQGKSNACSGHAVAALAFAKLKRNSVHAEPLSANFVYFVGRQWDETHQRDKGSFVRGCCEAIREHGVCVERLCPNDPTTVLCDPSVSAWEDAYKRRVFLPEKISPSLDNIKSYLDQQIPIACAIATYEGFRYCNNAKQDHVPMPKDGQPQELLHAVCITGYDDNLDCFRIRNSWGSMWGDHGYAWIPYEYLTFRGLGSDYWIIT